MYAEFYYAPHGLDVGFDPEFGSNDLARSCSVIARQGHQAVRMTQCDAALTPTEFQAESFPECFRDKISIIHDGIDTARLRPNPEAHVDLLSGVRLEAGDEAVTFIGRNLEPYRGYHSFMRALPKLMQRRAHKHIVIVGGDDVSYGARAGKGRTWKEVFFDEVRDRIDIGRVHFAGRVLYHTFIALLQCTRVHCYLTVPFVLSWSLFEAMTAGALIVGSRTAPVQEVIADGVNGRLVDFFDTGEIAETLAECLAQPQDFVGLRQAARAYILENEDLKTNCLPRLIDFVKNRHRD